MALKTLQPLAHAHVGDCYILSLFTPPEAPSRILGAVCSDDTVRLFEPTTLKLVRAKAEGERVERKLECAEMWERKRRAAAWKEKAQGHVLGRLLCREH